MASAYKILGQRNPLVTTLTTLYTVPALTACVSSTVVICNRSAVPTSYRLSVAMAGAANVNEQYLAYDVPILGNEMQTLTIGMSLAATDEVRCYATLATLSFNMFGVELT